jgi:PIN domain nuclease of toxin-antitoxin system
VILIDTHVLVWSCVEPEKLSQAAKAAIDEGRRTDGVAIASITLWELANAIARGRLESAGTVQSTVDDFVIGVEVKELTSEIVSLAAQFPETYPRDPADRLIGATARVLGVPLVTRDEKIRTSRAVRTIW